MENRDKEFLLEIKNALADLKNQIEEIENRIIKYEQSSDNEDIETTAIDLNIDDKISIEVPAETVEEEVIVKDEVPIETKKEEEVIVEDDIPTETKEEEEVIVEKEAPAVIEEAVIDAYADRQPWRKDMPGSHVNDIRSAISLNDRILFINTLFDEDPMKFQNTVTAINSMTTLKEVIEMIERDYPKWNMDSEVVYRFMMAVRRRVK